MKLSWMFMEYNGISLMDGNCIKSPLKNVLTFLNGSIFDFNFYSLNYRVASIEHPIMNTLLMKNYSTRSYLGILGFTIEASMELSTRSSIREC